MLSLFPQEQTKALIRPSNTTTYTAGDVISEVTTNDHFTFTNMSVANRTSGIIESARMQIQANTTALRPDLELWLFDTDIAEVADNSAFAPTDAEILTLIDVIEFPVADWLVGLSGSGASGNIVQMVNNLNIPYVMPAVSDSMFGQLVVRNAYVPISAEVFGVQLIYTVDK